MLLSRRVIRIAGVVSVTHYILAKCCDEIKTESGLYHHKTKRLVSTLLETIMPLIKLSRSDKTILNSLNVDIEDVDEDVNTQIGCVNDFADIFMNGGPNDLYNLSIMLDNIKNKKRLYTEEELNIYKNENK